MKRKNFMVRAKFSPVTELRRIIGRKNSLNIETILITINLITLHTFGPPWFIRGPDAAGPSVPDARFEPLILNNR